MTRKPYSVSQLAEHWACSHEAIYALLRKHARGEPGGLPHFTIGGKLYRIKAEVVDQWERNGGATKSDSIDLERSPGEADCEKRLSSGASSPADTDIDLVSSVRKRAELRSIVSLAASKP